MSAPLKCLVWRIGFPPQMRDQVAVGDVLRALDLLEAHSPSDLVCQDIVKILPGQERHPLYQAAYTRWQSRVGVLAKEPT